jgi:hypothetical protein
MVFRRRPDGVLVRELPAIRRVMPYLMRSRIEGTVYFPHRIEVDETLGWLEEVNAGRPAEEQIHLFHVLLTALGRTMRLRPEVNRFVAGRRTYQHHDITVTFMVKRHLDDDSGETEARLVLSGDETVDEVRARIHDLVHRQRGGAREADDKLTDFFASWPRPVLSGVAGLIRFLDYRNLMPRALVDAIPLYTSVYVVNTGSIGVDAPYHHLYENGSASVFVAIGRAEREPVVDERGEVVARSCLRLVYTLDERATDGFYFAKTAEVFRLLVAQPGLLERPDLTVDEIVPVWPPRK